MFFCLGRGAFSAASGGIWG